MPDDILTAAEAADYLKLSAPHVRAMAKEGRLPGIQIGDEWRFMRGQLYAYLVDQAEAQQRSRQSQHQVVKIAQQDGAITHKRGRPTKASAAEIIEKYSAQYGVHK
jgi:excisionase family DNA binding protein